MDESIYERYKRSGEIAAKARDYGVKMIKEDVNILDVTCEIESMILENGAELAFPVNISINEIAAHFTPRHDNCSVFKKGEVVKLDVGAHIDGYIADAAVTVEIGSSIYEAMITASKDALDNVIKVLKADIGLSSIGRVIEETIKSFNYKSIDNLTGHSLDRYTLHSGLSIPNVHNKRDKRKLKAGDVLAIEPFATNGAGHVISGKSSNIYRYNQLGKHWIIRNLKTRHLLDKIQKSFKTLPFAERWCTNLLPNTDTMLKKLIFTGCIKQYPQLYDMAKGIVTQAEHTVLIFEENCEVTT